MRVGTVEQLNTHQLVDQLCRGKPFHVADPVVLQHQDSRTLAPCTTVSGARVHRIVDEPLPLLITNPLTNLLITSSCWPRVPPCQVHVCMPSKKGHTRLLYRMSMDFIPWLRHVPFIDRVWKKVAAQVSGEGRH